MAYNPQQLTKKYKLSFKSAQEQKPDGGPNRAKLKLNLLDEQAGWHKKKKIKKG